MSERRSRFRHVVTTGLALAASHAVRAGSGCGCSRDCNCASARIWARHAALPADFGQQFVVHATLEARGDKCGNVRVDGVSLLAFSVSSHLLKSGQQIRQAGDPMPHQQRALARHQRIEQVG